MELKNPYVPKFVKIEKIFRETGTTATFRIKHPSDFNPGMFVILSELGIGETPIQISSYNPDFMDLCIQGDGKVTKKVLEMKEGQKIGLRGPYGHGYPMKQFLYKNLLIIGDGLSVGPIRGVIEYVSGNSKDFKDITIFLAFSSPSDVLFKKEINKWKDTYNVSTTVDNPDDKWNGYTGSISELLEKSELKKDNSIVITSCSHKIAKPVIDVLKKAGFEDSQIYMLLKRQIRCGIGKCGHCIIQNKYVCRDGPVFCYEESKNLKD